MKKFFTLLFALMAVMTINATTETLGITAEDLNSGDERTSYDETTGVITFSEAWAPRGWFFDGGADYSTDTYFVVRFAEALDGNGRLVIENTDGDYIAESFGYAGHYIICPLSNDSVDVASSIQNIYMMTSAANTVTLKDAYFTDAATLDEAITEAMVGMDIPQTVDLDVSAFNGWVDDGNGNYTFTLNGYDTWADCWFGSNFSDYIQIVIEIASTPHVIANLVVQYEGLGNKTSRIGKSATTKTYTLEEDYKSSVYQLAFQGTTGSSGIGDLTVSRIYLVRENYTTGIQSIPTATVVEDDPDAPIYNLQGQRVTKDTKGILIQNGKKFVNK